uniref:Pre-mRNA-splicing factor SYF2 n=1 Tax=Parascaris univalens TaxID=6257 RepID=A0A914ZR02_PARUN
MASCTEADQAASSSGAAKKTDFMERFKQLHQRRQESRKLNHEQVVEEDRKLKLPKNYEMRRKRQEWELEELELKKAAEERGEDYERLKALKTQADLAERKEFIKRKKHNPDKGFSDYEAMTLRQYDRLSGNIKPDMKSYEKMRDVVGADQFYPSANTLITGSHYPTDAAMEKLAEDINAQQKKRERYHRRRMFDPDAPIDYINERNRKFNEKLERFYGQYTEDLKGDLERGTAI